MPGLRFVADPDEAPLEFSEDNGYNVLAPVKSVPALREKLWASNVDTEGEVGAGSKTGNSEHTLGLRLVDLTEKGFRERQVQLEQKLYKLDTGGGVLRVIFPDDIFIDWEVRAINGGERLIDNRFVHHLRSQDEITFVCAPFGKGEEELVGEYEFEGDAERALECVVDGIGGSASALGRAVITSPDADVWRLDWGEESRCLSEDATAACLYPATALMPLGGATLTTATVDGKAGTPVVRQGTLTPNWTAMMSTGYLTHEGIYEVYAWIHMPATNTGEVGIGFEYWVGDIVHRVSLGPTYFPVDHAREAKVVRLALGQAFIQAGSRTEHFWEGHIIGRSTVAGDKLDVLDLGMRPLPEGNGTITISPTLNQPVTLLARDEFVQSSGPLNEKLLAAASSITGPNSPGTVSNDASYGTVPWVNPGNTKANDGIKARVELTKGETSNYLLFTDHGLALPAGAVIEGLTWDVDRAAFDSVGTRDDRVRVVKGGVIQPAERASKGRWPDKKDAVMTYGSATDTWEVPWGYSDLNSAGFGFAIAVKKVSGGKSWCDIDSGQVTVYWADASGQKWATTGDPADLAIEATGHVAKRTEVSDVDIDSGRYAVAGSTVVSDVVVGIKAKRGAVTAGSGERIRGGPFARYIDTSNWLYFGPDIEAPSAPIQDTARIIKRVAGGVTELDKVSIPESTDYRALWLQVDRRGRYFCWGSLVEGGLPRLLLAGQDNDLAEGGALDDGNFGFNDAKTGSLANTRNFDQFVVWIPPLDAAIYEGLSLELTHNSCQRQALGGAWSDITPQGDYLKLAPAGMENRKNRLVFIASPHDPDLMGVGFPSNLKVAIYATPRYRTVPDPA